jgi:tight adherence protein B
VRLIGTALIIVGTAWVLRLAAWGTHVQRSIGQAPDSEPQSGPTTGGTLWDRAAGAVGMLREHRRTRQSELEVPLLLEAAARGVRSGLSTRAGLAEAADQLVGPLRDEVETLNRRVGLGVPLSEALDDWRVANPRSGLALAATSLSLGSAAGGSRAQALESVATTLREREALRAEVKSLTTQARASAAVMAATPMGFLLLVTAGGGDAAGFLVGTRFGVTCLVSGLAAEAVGAAWMAWLTRAAL